MTYANFAVDSLKGMIELDDLSRSRNTPGPDPNAMDNDANTKVSEDTHGDSSVVLWTWCSAGLYVDNSLQR